MMCTICGAPCRYEWHVTVGAEVLRCDRGHATIPPRILVPLRAQRRATAEVIPGRLKRHSRAWVLHHDRIREEIMRVLRAVGVPTPAKQVALELGLTAQAVGANLRTLVAAGQVTRTFRSNRTAVWLACPDPTPALNCASHVALP